MASIQLNRVSVISFDFQQPKGSSQARKTKFFRELYGYTQQITQRLKSGEVVRRTYHYSGVLDQIPHVKLGKSVLGVQPGTEQKILQLIESFDEIVFFSFIAWLPASLSPGEEVSLIVNNRITKFGYLSLLITLMEMGSNVQETKLLERGFDFEYFRRAKKYLLECGYVIETDAGLDCTQGGEQLAKLLL